MIPRAANLLAFVLLFLMASSASAQLTWDPDANQTNDGGAGTWDTTSLNWDDNGSSPNVTWTNSSDAIFGSGTYQVDLTSAGVTVGNLDYAGGGTLEFRGSTATGSPGDAITVNPGGATWNTGGGEIEFFNDGNNSNTRLLMSSGDTLTVDGGGTFDTGQNPQNNANGTWGVGGANLDITSATTVRGDSLTIGQFDTVSLAGGSRYIHERNSDRTYTNNWVLGAGTVTFDNRFQRNFTLNGDISGAGGFKAEFLGNRHLILAGSNTFTGGIEVSNASRVTVDSDSIGTGDITLSGSTATNGGILRLLGGVDLGSRDVILNGTGGTIVNAGANSLNGNITGSGGLTIGSDAFSGNVNVLTLNGTANYTGDTNITRGSIRLGADNALSSASQLNIGGSGTTTLDMNGFDAEIGGLTSVSNNTRRVDNNGASESTLTIDYSGANTLTYASAFGLGGGGINVVKTGTGTQQITNAGATAASITVNDGTLMWSNDIDVDVLVVGDGALGSAGTLDITSTGSLAGTGTLLTETNVEGALGAGVAAGDLGTLMFDEDLTLLNNAATTFEFDSLSSFDILQNDNQDIFTADGNLNLVLLGYTAMLGDTFEILSDWGGFAGSFDSITGTDLGGGLLFDTSNLLSNGSITVIAAVPEPSSAFVMLLGLGACTLRRRRKI